MLKKKSLGQHFLRSASALAKIVEAGHLSTADTVIEVGPGEGVLTELLLQKAGKVVAVEKDDRLIPMLQKKFASEISSGTLTLMHADILKITPHLKIPTSDVGFSYKTIANIPYYITGTLIRKFLESETQPSTMVLLVQKEVAKRIVAADGRESILSISVKVYGAPRYIDTVKAGAFSPPPKVDSAILAIEDISKGFFVDGPVKPSCVTRSDLVKKEGEFFRLLRRGFAHPRKLLASNLGISGETLRKCGIVEKARPENLSVDDWKCLSTYFQDS